MATLVQPGLKTPLVSAAVGTVAAPANATGPLVAALPAYPGSLRVQKFAWDVVVGGTGALSALVINLLGSEDGVNWVQIDTYNGITSTRRDVVDKVPKFLAVSITTFTVGSGSPTVTSNVQI